MIPERVPATPGRRRPGCFVDWTVLCAGLAVLVGVWSITRPAPSPQCFEWCDLDRTIAGFVLTLLFFGWLGGMSIAAIGWVVARPKVPCDTCGKPIRLGPTCTTCLNARRR